jgi:hypothetical protein
MFQEDLKLGKKYEKIAIDMLGAGDTEICPEDAVFSDWDFKHNSVAYEVKSDRRAYKTGNLVFEYEHFGNWRGWIYRLTLSGITAH